MSPHNSFQTMSLVLSRSGNPFRRLSAFGVVRSAVLLTGLVIAPMPRLSADDSSRARAWQRWEHSLTSTADYANPYAGVTLRVRYSGPGDRELHAYGFWDGGRTFRIRCAFPTPGTWRWETACSDPANTGLHGQRGAVEVRPYRGNHALYRHGFLRVSEDRRHLAFADGTPFLWMGDTAWAAPYRATDREWETYLADRTAKHFSLIQITTPPRWGPADRAEREPFSGEGIDRWNPAYWQAVDRKIQRANEAGFVVFYTGLMEPTLRYPPADQACLFARNLVARLFGNFVIFSPSFDSRPTPLAHEVGRAIRDATTAHLITQHPGTGSGTPRPEFALYHADQPYMDFIAVQSGHNNGNRELCARQAIDWALDLCHHEPRKPVVNVEAMYDGHGDRAWQAVDARGLGWRSWLSGSMGYTYGAGDTQPKVPGGSGGIWRWSEDPDAFDHWAKALKWKSSTQMKYMRDFFAAFAWWRLEPAHELIRNQPEEAVRRMALARIPRHDFAVAYLPDNEAIEVDVSGFSAPLRARWFDPRGGGSRRVPGTISNVGIQRFTSPGGGDWVLVLKSVPGPWTERVDGLHWR